MAGPASQPAGGGRTKRSSVPATPIASPLAPGPGPPPATAIISSIGTTPGPAVTNAVVTENQKDTSTPSPTAPAAAVAEARFRAAPLPPTACVCAGGCTETVADDAYGQHFRCASCSALVTAGAEPTQTTGTAAAAEGTAAAATGDTAQQSESSPKRPAESQEPDDQQATQGSRKKQALPQKAPPVVAAPPARPPPPAANTRAVSVPMRQGRDSVQRLYEQGSFQDVVLRVGTQVSSQAMDFRRLVILWVCSDRLLVITAAPAGAPNDPRCTLAVLCQDVQRRDERARDRRRRARGHQPRSA